jgi:hypothetical protein
VLVTITKTIRGQDALSTSWGTLVQSFGVILGLTGLVWIISAPGTRAREHDVAGTPRRPAAVRHRTRTPRPDCDPRSEASTTGTVGRGSDIRASRGRCHVALANRSCLSPAVRHWLPVHCTSPPPCCSCRACLSTWLAPHRPPLCLAAYKRRAPGAP